MQKRTLSSRRLSTPREDPTRAFVILVEFESEFEELENRISELGGDIDGEINMEIDRLRGK